MNTPKHTPGPWFIGGLAVRHIVDINGVVVAEIPILKAQAEVCDQNTSTSNARLIALAPELADALRRCLPWLGKFVASNHHRTTCNPNDCEQSLAQARAVLAKLDEWRTNVC